MKISPDNVVQVVWAVWLASWVLAAGWSSPTDRRANTRSEFLYRAFTSVGAMLVFILHSSWWMMGVIWQPGAALNWMLAGLALAA
jgi:hypothetical protein